MVSVGISFYALCFPHVHWVLTFQELRMFSARKHSVTGRGFPISGSSDAISSDPDRSNQIQPHQFAHLHDTRFVGPLRV